MPVMSEEFFSGFPQEQQENIGIWLLISVSEFIVGLREGVYFLGG